MNKEQQLEFERLNAPLLVDTPYKAVEWMRKTIELVRVAHTSKNAREMAPRVFCRIGHPSGEYLSADEAMAAARMLDRILSESEIVLFSNDLWNLAHNGSEIFQNKPYIWDSNRPNRTTSYIFPESFSLHPSLAAFINDKTPLKLDHMTIATAGDKIAGFLFTTPDIDIESARDFAERWAGKVIPPDAPGLRVPRILLFGSLTCGAIPHGPVLSHVIAEAFMQSKVVASEAHAWTRQLRKGAARTNAYLPKVKTVVLRRRDPGMPLKSASNSVEWQHQWIVSGHWRNQWFPKAQENKPIFVDPYVKGPEGKPLLETRKTVYSVTR